MHKIIVLLVILSYNFSIAQQITVFYKEKRVPAQVVTKESHGAYTELKKYLTAALAKQKAAIRAGMSPDSIRLYRQKVDEEFRKISSQVIEKEKQKKPLTIPNYDYITILKINTTISLYYPQETVSNDTVSTRQTISDGKELVDERIHYNNSEIIYVDQSQKKMISSLKVHEFDQKGRKFLIEETLTDLDWIITTETKKIDQYLCYKAILHNSDKKVEAWFTHEIKANHGPKGYYGLPGLILELTEDKKTVSFYKINLLSLDNIEIKPPTAGEKITREELIDLPSKLFNEY